MGVNTYVHNVDSLSDNFLRYHIEMKVMGIPYNVSSGYAKPIELSSIVYDPCRVNCNGIGMQVQVTAYIIKFLEKIIILLGHW